MILRPKQIVFSKANTFSKNQINCIKYKEYIRMSNSNYPEGRKSIKIAKGAAEVLKSPQYGPLFTKLGD